MKKFALSFLCKCLALLIILNISSCKKINEYSQKPELESLQQGIKTSAALAYCASVVMAVAEGQALPDNIIYAKNTGLIYIKIDNNHPLPFNKNIGDIVIAFNWSGRAGLMSVLFANIDILGGKIKLCGLHLVPIMKQNEGDGIWAMFAKQDIIIGNGSDTLLDMSNISDAIFNSKVNQLNSEKPSDAFVAVKQNIWFININQSNTPSNVYDDNITINGGGQIAEVKGTSGGIIYHAMIGARLNYSTCKLNPIDGFALSQNFKVGGEPYIDLGNSFISFRNTCNGQAHVDFSTGKYITYNNKNISLNLN
jgi:hypothetical protein